VRAGITDVVSDTVPRHLRYLISNEMFRSKLRGNKICLSGWGLTALDRPPIRALELGFACDSHVGLLVFFGMSKSSS